MPFTPSHAVVALPFIRTPLVPAAIAIGAMTPDLPLFVRASPLRYGMTHDLAWLPATIVLSFVLLLVWRCVLRPAARDLVPVGLAARLPATWDGTARDGLRETLRGPAARDAGALGAITILVASLAIGVLSHIAWDLFTHEGRWGVTAIPALEQIWGPLAGYKWLQHGSSILGLAVLAIWGVLRMRRTAPDRSFVPATPAPVRVAWWLSLPLALAVAWGVGLALFGPLDDRFTAAHLAYRVLPPSCGLWGLATVLLCIAIQLNRVRRRTSVA